ncbi:MAG: GNAT family N-acetyltransferase [Bacteroidota bacterium]
MVLFETERLTVRRFTANDSELFYQLNGNPDVVHFIRPVKTREESDTFLQENLNFYLDTSCLGRFAVFVKDGGRFIGTFSFLYLSGDADFHLGYALLPQAWGQGFATELVISGIPYFFARTDKDIVFAITSAANKASQRVLLKSGFLYKGQVEEHGQTLELFYINRNLGSRNDIENE